MPPCRVLADFRTLQEFGSLPIENRYTGGFARRRVYKYNAQARWKQVEGRTDVT